MYPSLNGGPGQQPQGHPGTAHHPGAGHQMLPNQPGGLPAGGGADGCQRPPPGPQAGPSQMSQIPNPGSLTPQQQQEYAAYVKAMRGMPQSRGPGGIHPSYLVPGQAGTYNPHQGMPSHMMPSGGQNPNEFTHQRHPGMPQRSPSMPPRPTGPMTMAGAHPTALQQQMFQRGTPAGMAPNTSQAAAAALAWQQQFNRHGIPPQTPGSMSGPQGSPIATQQPRPHDVWQLPPANTRPATVMTAQGQASQQTSSTGAAIPSTAAYGQPSVEEASSSGPQLAPGVTGQQSVTPSNVRSNGGQIGPHHSPHHRAASAGASLAGGQSHQQQQATGDGTPGHAPGLWGQVQMTAAQQQQRMAAMAAQQQQQQQWKQHMLAQQHQQMAAAQAAQAQAANQIGHGATSQQSASVPETPGHTSQGLGSAQSQVSQRQQQYAASWGTKGQEPSQGITTVTGDPRAFTVQSISSQQSQSGAGGGGGGMAPPIRQPSSAIGPQSQQHLISNPELETISVQRGPTVPSTGVSILIQDPNPGGHVSQPGTSGIPAGLLSPGTTHQPLPQHSQPPSGSTGVGGTNVAQASSLSATPELDIAGCLRMLRQLGYERLAAGIEEDRRTGRSAGDGVEWSLARAAQSIPSSQSPEAVLLNASRQLSPRENPVANLKNYCDVYSEFREWVGSASIPGVRGICHELLFVLLAEMWIRLVVFSPKTATQLLKEFAGDHQTKHQMELAEMRHVHSLSAVAECPFAQRLLRGDRFVCRMDALTRRLVTTYLVQQTSTLIIDVLQRRAQIESMPWDISSADPLAVLVSQVQTSRPYGPTRDVGHRGFITPSLAALCGLLVVPQPRESNEAATSRILQGEPTATQAPLFPDLAVLYRLPVSPSPSTNSPHAWRHKLKVKHDTDRFKRRQKLQVTEGNSVTTATYCVGWRPLAKGGPWMERRVLSSIEIKGIEPAEGQQTAVYDRDANCLYVWDLLKAQWEKCIDEYQKVIVKPWVYRYSKSRMDRNATVENILETAGPGKHGPAGVSIKMGFGNSKLELSEHQLAQALRMATAAEADAGESFSGEARYELFCKALDEIAPEVDQPRVYSPAALFGGHRMPISAFRFVPPFWTGGCLNLGMSTGYDGNTILWDIDHETAIYTYKGGGAASLALDVDQFGTRFVTANVNRAALLWSIDRQSPLRVLNRHTGSVEAAEFHPNCLMVATGCCDGMARLWDARVPDIVGSLGGITGAVREVKFAPNGKLLAISSQDDSVVQVWDMVAGKLFQTLHTESIKGSTTASPTSMTYSYGSELLAIANGDGLLQLWDATGTVTRDLTAVGPGGVSVADAWSLEASPEFLSAVTDLGRKALLEEYEYAEQWARKVLFTETNLLICATEARDWFE